MEAEIILGCRRTSGEGEGKSKWGIDLYGNDRLFVELDQETFSSLLPTRGVAKNLILGLINLRGPNTFIPWTCTRDASTQIERSFACSQSTQRSGSSSSYGTTCTKC